MKRRFIILLIMLTFLTCKKRDLYEGDIPFTYSYNLPIIVDATINGKPSRILIDTGANLSLIDITKDRYYKFWEDSSSPSTTGLGLGGEANIYPIQGVVLEYKDKILDVKFKGTDLSGFKIGSNFDAIIGSDYLRRNNLVVDFHNRKLKQGSFE